MTHANVIALHCVIDTLEDGSYHPVSGGPIVRLASSNLYFLVCGSSS
jgi:hypothetical protein